MRKIHYIIGAFVLIGLPALSVLYSFRANAEKEEVLSYTVNLEKQDLRFFWKDDQGNKIKNFKKLKNWLSAKDTELIFAMNGGMFMRDYSPQGLYIEDGQLLIPRDTLQKGYGNFYLQPNGIFYITEDKKGVVCKNEDYPNTSGVTYATQSGPMLLINGKMHLKFMKGSKNVHIRNGVGILPNGEILFALSKQKINFYDFASYFKKQGCRNALYLDGFVSRVYLPEKNWKQLEGDFGVIIAEVSLAR